MKASAPGKLLLVGEYAVLEGGMAAVMAIDRRARAHLGPEPRTYTTSPFLLAARAVLDSELGADSPPARAAGRVLIDTSELFQAGGAKLGLGSSAALTTAALAACLAQPDRPLDRSQLHRLAHRAHAEAQAAAPGGVRGSGADVAASVWGGVVAIAPPPTPGATPGVRRVELPPDLHLVAVWTGQPANTRDLVAQVTPLARRDPAAWRGCLDEIRAAAAAFLAACSRSDAPAAVTALAAGGWAVAALGRAANAPLELEIHRRLAQLAEARGGALKPTGAGGGDVALAAFAQPGQAEQFRADVADLGMTALELGVDHRGADLDPA